LTTELQYQDPTDPVDNTEMVSQMAQLNILEQLNTINTNMTFYQSTSLIGQEVTYQTTDSSGSTTTATGTVDSVITSSGETYLNIDGTLISPSAVLEVTASA
jgi:flagellar basal-body rod modification protein FlgD